MKANSLRVKSTLLLLLSVLLITGAWRIYAYVTTGEAILTIAESIVSIIVAVLITFIYKQYVVITQLKESVNEQRQLLAKAYRELSFLDMVARQNDEDNHED